SPPDPLSHRERGRLRLTLGDTPTAQRAPAAGRSLHPKRESWGTPQASGRGTLHLVYYPLLAGAAYNMHCVFCSGPTEASWLMRQVNRRFRLAVLVALTATVFQPGQVRPSWDAARASAAEPPLTLFGSAPDAPDSELQSIVEDVVSDLPGTWGVAIKK